jgi:hypothetical protein
VLDHGAERERREIGEAADDQDDGDEKPDEEPAMRREGARRCRHDLLGGERAGDRQHRHDHQEAADQHREAQRRIVEERVGAQPGEGAAVIAGGGDIGVERLAEAVRSGIGEPGEPRRHDDGDRREAQHR